MSDKSWIADRDAPILITGSNGFIGSHVVQSLLNLGFGRLRCLVRSSSDLSALHQASRGAQVEVMVGNLCSREDCRRAVAGARLIYHLAAGIEKTFAGSFLNSVVTTRNLLDAALEEGCLRRFVNVGSFSVYCPDRLPRRALLDEQCPIENEPVLRSEPYMYAKLKQDEIVCRYGRQKGLPYVIVRPGAVWGPGNKSLTGRVGLDTFGFFLHLGGSNRLPLTYVCNCADAIVLAGLAEGIDGEVFNVVDDDLPTSRQFLRLQKKLRGGFFSLYLPFRVFYLLSLLWEKYSGWSQGQLPPAFNRKRCNAYWKGHTYSNQKLKSLVGWSPRVPFQEALQLYSEDFKGVKA